MHRALERVAHPEGPVLWEASPHGVRIAFTERTGGVSEPPFASLNLGSHVGDDPRAVGENRRRVLAAMGAGDLGGRLVVPNQVHGDEVVVIRSPSEADLARVRDEAARGADAVVSIAPDVPVMLCFADCVPVVLACPGGFAVVHSGWKGTYAGIAGKAARVLAREAGCDPSVIEAYVGPHILGGEYEVSEELMDRFRGRFQALAGAPGRLLDLSAAIRESLLDAGVVAGSVLDPGLSTFSGTDRFFSHRAEHGRTGRHAAVAVMRP